MARTEQWQGGLRPFGYYAPAIHKMVTPLRDTITKQLEATIKRRGSKLASSDMPKFRNVDACGMCSGNVAPLPIEVAHSMRE